MNIPQDVDKALKGDFTAEDSPEAIEVQEVAASEFKRLVERLKEQAKKKVVDESSNNP